MTDVSGEFVLGGIAFLWTSALKQPLQQLVDTLREDAETEVSIRTEHGDDVDLARCMEAYQGQTLLFACKSASELSVSYHTLTGI